MIPYFANLLVICVAVYIPVTCTDISAEEPSDNAFQVLKRDNISEGLIDKAFLLQECDCGDHGSCVLVDQVQECKCDEKYAVKASKCEYCDCGPWSEKCSFNSAESKICQCRKGSASKTARWSSYGTWCEICDCGDHGKCSWSGDEKICDCKDGFRIFGGKCTDCNCGEYGTCEFNEFGEKVCSCDDRTAERDGTCQVCDCDPDRKYTGIDCKFYNGVKQCICPPGFKANSGKCEEIDECSIPNRCPANRHCVNTPGTFECRCNKGFEPFNPSSDPKLSGCIDIDECLYYPCESLRTKCVNSPGSYDCVCKDGYYSTSGNYGSSYNPIYNTCLEIETQWREATIALGVILSFAIIAIIRYIAKHKHSL